MRADGRTHIRCRRCSRYGVPCAAEPEAGQYLNQLSSVGVQGLDTASPPHEPGNTTMPSCARPSCRLQAARPLQWVARADAGQHRRSSGYGRRYRRRHPPPGSSRTRTSFRSGDAAPAPHRAGADRPNPASRSGPITALMDGWSASRLMADVLRHYQVPRSRCGARRYRDYIAWLARSGMPRPARRTGANCRLDQPCLLGAALAVSSPDAGYGLDETTLDAAENGRARAICPARARDAEYRGPGRMACCCCSATTGQRTGGLRRDGFRTSGCAGRVGRYAGYLLH